MITRSTPASWFQDGIDYWVDAGQRTILFWDVLRQRGNTYFQHLEEGQPPVLYFDYETIIDGRRLEKPVNYALARIIPPNDATVDPNQRPVVVIDPRAGHGPGIGGSKRDSEIGRAFDAGHPVYFMLFYPEPMPGQTLADVEHTQIIFIEEVARRHPDALEPAVIGNCQAGWAVALLGADRPDLTGPMVINGAPLSYWSGVEGANPMRYKGGLIGGSWLAHMMSDLGHGTFDGAHLVANFETLNPANTIWSKQYNLYANVDTEAKRYLDFEKWWGGFFTMTGEEIGFIVENLFVGNKLEQGEIRIGDNRTINLKKMKDPMMVFASNGDNITPPQQALNWIAKVYGTVEEIRRCQQVIVYMLHEKIGHLGIFVSGSVANKEHREIIGTLDMMEYLQPGLYEMVITEKEGTAGITDYDVRFEERDIADLLALDDGLEEETAFDTVARVSEYNTAIYKSMISPWVKLFTNTCTAEVWRQTHPLRLQRTLVSDLNPFFWPLAAMAETVKENRKPVATDNLFRQLQEAASRQIVDTLNCYRDQRDLFQEKLFFRMYDNPWMKMLFPVTAPEEPHPADLPPQEQKPAAGDRAALMADMEAGGFPEAVVRIMLAVCSADGAVDKCEYLVAQEAIRGHARLKKFKPETFRDMVKTQSRMLQTDPERAIAALPKMVKTARDRKAAVEMARNIAMADTVLHLEEQKLLEKIETLLAS
ncbi:MAG: DUF3141 domain-containing protein [Deltaproteobacteria bacterium]|nr:DUF3141 domain-containing protein [Candidatus Anaeroferrophillacea bacterium]